MRVLTTTQAREKLSDIVNRVRFRNETYAIGRRNVPEVLFVRYPRNLNASLTEEKKAWKDELERRNSEIAGELGK